MYTSRVIDKYKCAVIGCGRMGSLFDETNVFIKPSSHGGMYYNHLNTELVAACDIDTNKVNNFSKKWKCKNTYADYREMLEKENIDILSICTHAYDHAKMCVDGAKSGVKAIFCEKPMATSIRECEQMIKVCEDNKVHLTIDHTRRWDSYFKYIKNILEENKLGKINAVSTYATAGLLNGGAHMFDMLRYYFGDAIWIDGKLEYDNSTDPSATGCIKFKDLIVYFNNSYKEYVTFDIHIIGSRGRIISSGMVRSDRKFELMLPKDSLYDKGTKTLSKEEIPEKRIKKLTSLPINLDIKISPMLNALEDIINSIENNCDTNCTGYDGKSSLEIALAFHESDRCEEKVHLPMKNKYLRVIPRMTSFTEDGKFD